MRFSISLLQGWLLVLAAVVLLDKVDAAGLGDGVREDLDVGLLSSDLNSVPTKPFWDIFTSQFDFWEEAQKLKEKAQTQTSEYLQMASLAYPDVAQHVSVFKDSMDLLVLNAANLRVELLKRAEERGITMDGFTELLEKELEKVQEELKVLFPPTDQAAGHAERVVMIESALKKVEDCVVRLIMVYGFEGEEARNLFLTINPHLLKVLVTTGDIIEQHPVLIGIVVATGVYLILPESFFLRPLLNIFGFGIKGPIKGSFAARAQSQFLGGAVPKGSWHASLVSAGMKVNGGIWSILL